MRALPTRRRVVPTALMALGFTITLAGSFGFTPVSSADEGTADVSASGYHYGSTTTVYEYDYDTTTTVPQTTTTVDDYETTTTVPQTTTTVPQTTTTVADTTTTTVAKTTTTVAQTTTTVGKTTTTVPVSVLPTTTINMTTTTVPAVEALAQTGSTSSMPMIGIGVSLFVIGLIIMELRATQTA